MSKLNLLTQNSKIKKSGSSSVLVYNFGIPAFQSKTGLKTCPNAGLCASGCYARSGAYLFSNVAKKFEERLAITLQDNFSELMQLDIDIVIKKAKGQKIFIRIHDSGDFYNEAYYSKWRAIMNNNPEITFYAYTKQIEMFKSLEDIKPNNFILTFSYGGKQDFLIDSKNDRHSMVFESKTQLQKLNYIDASDSDLLSLGDNKKVGLVFHHAKNYENTLWSKVTTKEES